MGADARTNRALWSEANSQFTDARAERAWAAPEITWGLFDVPETDVVALGELPGRDLIELGCGTAYFSAWLAVRGSARRRGRNVRATRHCAPLPAA